MKVLVIGGGIGGLTVCTSLRKFDKHVEIILVEPKEYMEIHWCSYRNLFDADLAEDSVLDIKNWAVAKAVKHIRATVTNLTATEATVSNSTEVIEFNVCCICTGSQTRFPGLGKGPPSGKGKDPGSTARRLQQLKVEGNKLLNANNVLIVGGGIIGVETAGDLAYFSKAQNKNVHITLVQSGNQLIPEEFTPHAGEMTKKKLEKLGVKVILNERVVRKKPENQNNKNNNNTPPKLVFQSTGREVNTADTQVVWTTGIFPCNSSFLDRKYLNQKGWIKVDEYFRVKGAENKLFALGDCCDLLPNQGVQILGTLNVIGKNIRAVLKALEKDTMDGVERKMRKALVSSEVYCVTVGKQTGVALTPMGHTQFMLPWVKNSTMFLFNIKGQLGLK